MYYIRLQYILLYYIILYYIILYCIIVDYIILYMLYIYYLYYILYNIYLSIYIYIYIHVCWPIPHRIINRGLNPSFGSRCSPASEFPRPRHGIRLQGFFGLCAFHLWNSVKLLGVGIAPTRKYRKQGSNYGYEWLVNHWSHLIINLVTIS